MKKKTLLALLENTEKSVQNVNDDSFYDGHKFVEYGKNIPNVTLIPTSGGTSIDKNSLAITWGLKFQFINTGIEGAEINVLDLEAKLTTGEPINFGEYRFNVIQEKNPESKELQLYIDSIEIDTKQRIVNVIVSI